MLGIIIWWISSSSSSWSSPVKKAEDVPTAATSLVHESATATMDIVTGAGSTSETIAITRIVHIPIFITDPNSEGTEATSITRNEINRLINQTINHYKKKNR